VAIQSGIKFCLVYNTAETGTGTSSTFTTLNGDAFPSGVNQDMGRFSKANLLLDVTASTAPTTLDVWIQKKLHTFNGTAVWTDVGHFTQVGAVATAQRTVQIETTRAANTGNESAIQAKAIAAATFNNGPWGDEWRVAWTVVGTSYTFTVTVAAWP
jgi:hypothetical protein